MASTEITEIRSYTLTVSGELKLAQVIAFPSPERHSPSNVVGKMYSRATVDARFVGTEYVVDAHGPDEEVTDWSGDCPTQRGLTADSGTWQRELAMEAGMLHGVDAYNDLMGY